MGRAARRTVSTPRASEPQCSRPAAQKALSRSRRSPALMSQSRRSLICAPRLCVYASVPCSPERPRRKPGAVKHTVMQILQRVGGWHTALQTLRMSDSSSTR